MLSSTASDHYTHTHIYTVYKFQFS